MDEEFISEAIKPVEGTFDTAGMAIGEPGLPGRFVWRDKEYEVAEVLEKWKESGKCKGGSSEMYLRKHWFKVRCSDGSEMTIYFERQPRSKRQNKNRWWLYTIKQG
jgi:phosphoribosylglycinamide formyltransferase-1